MKGQLKKGRQGRESGPDPELQDLELLLEAVFNLYGVDFRGYAYSSLKRRVKRQMMEEGIETILEMRDLLINDPKAMDRLKVVLTVHVTAMFRDPGFYLAFRKEVVPILKTYPYLRLWVAGCSTGEEVYSLAILLHEEELYPRCRIYATDVSPIVLEKAKAGIFPLAPMKEYTTNYQKAGGNQAFSEYYTADNENAIFRPFLKENLVFATHNLAGDASFNEFNVIFCRNVMIYFAGDLQNRVQHLFHTSLLTFGFLGLGRSESLRFTACEEHYGVVSQKERLYRKTS